MPRKTPRRATLQRIEKRRAECLPLQDFPSYMRDRIMAEAAAPCPPEKWIPVGSGPKPLAWLPSRGWYEWHWDRGIDPESRRDRLPAWLRAAVIARDGHVCQLCGGPVERGDVHIDHITPYSTGGLDVLDNLQVTHSLCNMRKGAKI